MTNNTVSIVLQFALATLLPVAAAATLQLLSHKPWLANMSHAKRQIFYGIIFGAIAIFGTEFGIATTDATMNVRDAAPIVAGLYFGSPAGIIAGIIGGVERWFAALWGRGEFTRVACSVATMLAGVYAAALNRYLFTDRKPTWLLGLAVGVVAEVLHLLLVFLTNLDNASRAFTVVQACTLPMVTLNGVSVALTGAVLARMSGKRSQRTNSREREISQVIQSSMLSVVMIGFVATVGFTFALQQSTIYAETVATLKQEIADVDKDIHDASDVNILYMAQAVANLVPSVEGVTNEDLATLAVEAGVSDIHVINSEGIIVASNLPDYVGFDMASGEQSAAFLVLLPGGSATSFVQSYQPEAIDSTVWRKFAGMRISDGFVQVGYDSDLFFDDIKDQVELAIKNRHVRQTGFFVVLSENSTLVGTRDDVTITNVDAAKLANDTDAHEEGQIFSTNVQGEEFYAMHHNVEGFRVIALIPMAEANGARDLSVLVTSFMEVLVFAALFAAIYLLIRHVVVNSIWQVNGTLNQITSGNLEAKVNVRNSSEFSSLSDDINRTVGALRNAIAAESKRIETDLATAKAIQSSALPSKFPPFPDINAFDIYASMNAAREVGGDFYDFFLVDDHTLGFFIADVSGKGIPAALFMMRAKSELSNYIKSGMDLAEAVRSANIKLCEGNDAGMFVTVWAATLDYNTGRLTYVNAAHNPPLLRHDGSWEWLTKKGGLFLGTYETAKYRSATLTLEPSDELLLYTDGVNEAFNVNEEEYGNKRLEAFLANHNSLHPRLLVDTLRADVKRWAKGAEQSDDVTMLCLEYGVPPEVVGTFTVKATSEGFDELLRRTHFELYQLQCPEHVQRQIDLVLEELITNIHVHGYANSDKPGKVELQYMYNSNPSSIVIALKDWGVPFDPLGYERGDDEGDEVTGAGITLAIASVDDISYVRDGEANIIAFKKGW